MDSTTLLYHLVKTHGTTGVVSLGVDYGQRHRKELEYAATICRKLRVERRVLDLTMLANLLPGSALTDRSVDVPHGHYEDESMKSTVVPNRNMILLSLAASVAIANDMNCVAYAAHAGDHAIYPDCRPVFFERMGYVLEVCHYDAVRIDAPFMDWDKGQIAQRGEQLHVPWELTWTCYEGGDVHCGACGACQERREALHGYCDPTSYAND
jgi:7-cyano-7-deazaguanine synthase